MTESDVQAAMTSVLSGIAPEADLDAVDPRVDLREELELDSIDFFHFLVGLSEELNVDIPESKYGQLTTKAAILEYMTQASAPSTRPE